MLLTGKALKDFTDKHPTISFMPLICEYALIIEWFDSVGIYIGIQTEEIYEHTAFNACINESNLNQTFNSRQEATRQAIIKANDIYNAKH